jgi:hypothetical protein
MDNKIGKYLTYAIGEIVLVVIGILIALSINNWNEEQIIKEKESLILKELLNSINSDLQKYQDLSIPRLERKKAGIDSLESYIFAKKEIEDSLFLDFYSKLTQDIYMGVDDGPFEALKSSGLEIISNDSLRTALNKVYTSKLPAMTFFTKDARDSPKEEIYELQYKFLKLSPIIHSDGRKLILPDLKVNDILNNQDFLWVFNLENRKYQIYNNRFNELNTTLLELKMMIENEL